MASSGADADVLIVGGGPAGMMIGLLLARSGVPAKVVEKHADFFRDFRGDTVHPSTMEILDQLGLLEDFLSRPHNRLTSAQLRIDDREWKIGDLSHLATPAPFIAMMPQWDFLDFLRHRAQIYPGFEIAMDEPVTGFVEEEGRVVGIRYASGREEKAAKLVVAADGRSSLVRSLGLLPVETLGAPMDVLWFRLPKAADDGYDALRGSVQPGRMVVLIDRDDYWQAAFLIPKGTEAEVRARGVDWVREQVQRAFPDLDLSAALASHDEVKLLSVSLDRLTRWSRPGLLAIGDAAHAMSPIGGVGINLAIQDAVAAANILARPLRDEGNVDALLDRVQARRLLPTRIIQAGQRAAQDRIIGRVLGGAPFKAPALVRLLDRFPLLRRVPGRLIGLGIRRGRVRSPNAYPDLS